MNTDEKNHLGNIRRIALISLAISIFTIIDQYPQYHGMGSLLGTFSGSRLFQISPVVVIAILDIAFLWFSNRDHRAQLLQIPKRIILALRKAPLLCWLCFTIIGLVLPILVLTSLAPEFDFMLTRLWIFGHLVLLGSLFLRAALPGHEDLGIVAVTALTYALVENIALHIPEISTQITSMGWSEASRYYYASLFFSNSVYGISAPLPSLHPSRYLLQSIPFLIPNLPIWVHRAWQVTLWLVLPLMGSFFIIRRLTIKQTLVASMVVIWGFLFLNQGSVYYHLMVCVIIVAAGFSTQRPLRSLLIVILASIWAGISRINWYPVPGLLAVVFYLLEVPHEGKSIIKYWLWPVIWTLLGLLAAFLSETAYIAISGNPVENFGTSFTSSLLWYRLLPNITYPPGVLLSILLAILPVIILLILKLGRSRSGVQRDRVLILIAILVVFFAGGIVVSVKIGGGGDLHNLDACLVFFLIAAVYCYYERVVAETGHVMNQHPVHWIVTALLICIPVFNVAQADAEISHVDNQPILNDLATLQKIIDATPTENGQILFISQRHFITFNYIHGVSLVPDYEKVFLMEMAMAGNQAYFNQFEEDLKTHRFALIVSEPLYMVIQDEQYMFSEENNAWTTRVTALIRMYYHEIVNLPNASIIVSEPNP
jgi:hypothetical protein